MNTKRTIRKILFIGLWLLIGTGMVTLLAAAMRKQKNERCTDYEITIKGATKNLFIDQKDVVKLISDGTGGKIKGQLLANIRLRQLEQLLEDNQWIKDAELYFDNKAVLKVTVIEREPIARVFTPNGKSFYIDSDERMIPLSGKLSAQVPVFTGFPVNKVVAKRDSILLHQVKAIAMYIGNDEFWTSQVAQVDITGDREFELVPLVGNHIVRLGSGEDIERKFERLFIFYKEVLSKAGFDKYQAVDVRFTGQVVGVKGEEGKVDSLQLKKRVQQLLEESRNMAYRDIAIPATVEPATVNAADTVAVTLQNNSTNISLGKQVNPNPVKRPTESNASDDRQPPKPATNQRRPKAVMDRRQ